MNKERERDDGCVGVMSPSISPSPEPLTPGALGPLSAPRPVWEGGASDRQPPAFSDPGLNALPRPGPRRGLAAFSFNSDGLKIWH